MSSPVAIRALDAALRPASSALPEVFRQLFQGREKRPLGEVFGLTNFGVNLTRLQPGARSSLFHKHSLQDELVYVLEGRLTLITPEGETELEAGMCAGFKAGSGRAHQMLNRGDSVAVYLEIGDRTVGDHVEYPNDDLDGRCGADGVWHFTRKDGSAF